MKYGNINDYETIYMINEDDENAYNIVFDKYKPIIVSLACKFHKKFYNIGIEYDDLYQEGMIGLSQAISRFNINNQNTFYTFAVLCIKRQMQRLIVSSMRNKNSVLNFSKSIEEKISDQDMTLNDILVDYSSITEDKIMEDYFISKLISFKYSLNDKQMQVFELKLNGFTNSEIACLLDIKYKEVDNCLYKIRKQLKKIKIQVESCCYVL